MGRAEFQYDEVGNTFYYVLISFYAILLLPATYFFFPTWTDAAIKVDERLCQCFGCVEKRKRKAASQPWRKTKKIAILVGLAVAWLFFALLVQKVSTIESTHEEYDPYSILELDQGAPTELVKKAYRDLSKKYHPDRGGDALTFDRIAKAYQALTDNESRENWEKYGNPDGPTATTFGIALPKWLVSKEYGVWVLAAYGLTFIIILPIVVGIWWYNSIKYTTDKVLLDTTQLFGYFLRKTPRMEINRALMVLGGAFEFNKDYNSEIKLRQTDDRELPILMKQLPNLNETKKEMPLSLPYSLKARILIHAHLARLPVGSETLEFDQRYTVSRCYRLVEEMINISQQLNYYGIKIPLETMDNLLRLLPMLVQAQWARKSALLQLPHIGDHNLGYIQRQKVMTCADLAKLDNEKRKQVLNSLSDLQYRDVLRVLTAMPRLSIETAFEVKGEDDHEEITAGCIVTLKVKLTRRSLLDPEEMSNEAQRLLACDDDDLIELKDSDEEATEGDKDKEENDEKADDDNKPKRKVWEKQPKKGAKAKKGGKAKKAGKPAAAVKKVAPNASPAESSKESNENKEQPVAEKNNEEEDKDEDAAGDGGDSSDDGDAPANSGGDDSENEEDWKPEQKSNPLEGVSYETLPVHSPFYPGDKYEWWWLMLTRVDKKTKLRQLICTVTPCKTLVDSQTVDLRFMAPEEKGTYVLNLTVRSDSYMDSDYSIEIKMDVKEAKQVVLPKYEDTEDEEDEHDHAAACSSDEYTEDSEDDD